MTDATIEVWSYRSQRLTLPSGERTWTVLGADHRMVEPAEEYLEYLRAQQASPNTVKSYARALALWWQYLDAFGLRWDSVRLESFGAFLTWLRTGDVPDLVSIERRPARFAESTIAARLHAVVSCYDYHVLEVHYIACRDVATQCTPRATSACSRDEASFPSGCPDGLRGRAVRRADSVAQSPAAATHSSAEFRALRIWIIVRQPVPPTPSLPTSLLPYGSSKAEGGSHAHRSPERPSHPHRSAGR